MNKREFFLQACVSDMSLLLGVGFDHKSVTKKARLYTEKVFEFADKEYPVEEFKFNFIHDGDLEAMKHIASYCGLPKQPGEKKDE